MMPRSSRDEDQNIHTSVMAIASPKRLVRPATRKGMSRRHSCLTPGLTPRGLQTLRHRLPLNVLKEGADVLGRGGVVIHLVRMLVHIHYQYRQRGRRAVRMVGQPIVYELAGMVLQPSITQPAPPPKPAPMRRNSVSHVSQLPKASAIAWCSIAPACPLPP